MLRVLLAVLFVTILVGAGYYVWEESARGDEVFSELLVQRQPLLYPEVSPPLVGEELQSYVQKLARLVTYPYVVTAALREEHVSKLPWLRDSDDPEQEIADALVVTPVVESDHAFLRISMGGRWPAADRAIVINAVVGALQDEVIDRDSQMERQHLDELQAEVRKGQAELDRERQLLVKQRASLEEMVAANEVAATIRTASIEALAGELARQRLALVEAGDPPRSKDDETEAVLHRVRKRIVVLTDHLQALGTGAEGVAAILEKESALEQDAETLQRLADRVAELEEREFRTKVELEHRQEHPPVEVKRAARP